MIEFLKRAWKSVTDYIDEEDEEDEGEDPEWEGWDDWDWEWDESDKDLEDD